MIEEVDRLCREQTIYMLGPEKARRLAELVRQKQPNLVVECGTAIGYSGLWIAGELQAAGTGKLITLEIDAERAKTARANFSRASLGDMIDVRVGDARQLASEVEGPVDFLFIDCNPANYLPCFQAVENQLSAGAIVVADNAGLAALELKDYLEYVRSRFPSTTEWFDIDLPWGKRDAMEITVFRPIPDPAASSNR